MSGKATRSLPGEDGSDAERAALENKHAKRIYAAFQSVLLKVAPSNTTVRNVTVDKAIERWRANRNIVRDALVDMLTDGVLLGADVGRQQVEVILGVGKAPVVVGGVDWDMINVNALRWVTGSGQMGGGLGGGYANALAETMSATTETGLRTIFGEWISNNLSYRQLVQQLDRTVFGRTRAEMISVTECTRAYAQGTLESYRGSRVVKRVRWQAVGDERVCPQCGPLNQTVALISEGFPGGVMPPRHVRCRCWISGVVDIADFERPQTEQAPLSSGLSNLPSSVIVESDGAVAQLHIAHYRMIPDVLRTAVEAEGVKVYISNDKTLPGIDDQGKMAGVQPRGWPKGMTWDIVPGAYSVRDRYVIAGSGAHGSSSVLLHEYGHAIGHVLNYDNDVRLIAAHTANHKYLEPYFQQGGAGGFAGRGEMLAEAFAETIVNRNLAVLRFGQDTVDFIENVVMKLGKVITE